MVEATGGPIAGYFAALEDPRLDRTRSTAPSGAVCGADSWVDIELFGNCKVEWFRSFLELPGRPRANYQPLLRI